MSVDRTTVWKLQQADYVRKQSVEQNLCQPCKIRGLRSNFQLVEHHLNSTKCDPLFLIEAQNVQKVFCKVALCWLPDAAAAEEVVAVAGLVFVVGQILACCTVLWRQRLLRVGGQVRRLLRKLW
ncbi:hypothetical protein E2C01_033058 [Portunus trituberculatus]|uniref:Uncharacterized protein n=1 Tax=Portunus trituberculatus TaxID=210409 RepID=A0A5B7EXK2_PORTR|nr:hypothetical protein [Portunus trituberculatus]